MTLPEELRFKEQNPEISDIFTNCFNELADNSDLILGYYKMILQHAPYEMIIERENLLNTKIFKTESIFSIRTGTDQSYFRYLDDKMYDLSIEEKNKISKFCELVKQNKNKNMDIFTEINLGASYDKIYNFKRGQTEIWSEMSKLTNGFI